MRKIILAVCAMCFSTPVLAEDLVITAQNNTSIDILELYTTPVNVSGWEEDVTGDQNIAAGETAEITV